MQNNKLIRFLKDLSAQHYALCNLTAAEVKYIEKTIIGRLAFAAKGQVRRIYGHENYE